MTTTAPAAYADAGMERPPVAWWVLLLTGIAWIIVAVLVLDADFDSAVTIGYLVGGFLLAGGVMEFVLLGVVPGWRWLHAILGVLFILTGIAAFTSPFQTFGILASMVGLLLVLKGTFDFFLALATRHEVDLWWMMLVSGILEVLLGFWASGYPGRSAALLVLWVGIGALIRWVTHLIMAFQVRKIERVVV